MPASLPAIRIQRAAGVGAVQLALLGKLITKSQSIVEETESDNHLSVVDRCLLKRNCKFLVVITNLFFLSPYRCPGFVLLGWFGFDDGESSGKGGQLFQFNPQPALLNDRFTTEGKVIGRLTVAVQRERQ